ncbi:MAG TPA: M4 family metallopeptidase [Thermoanaerobaculia bacterium]
MRHLAVLLLVAMPSFGERPDWAAKLAAARPVAEKKLAELVAAADRDGDTTAKEDGNEVVLGNEALFRYQQFHHGVRVDGSSVSISVIDGRAHANGHFLGGLNVNPVPNLTRADGERIARAHVKVTGPCELEPELVILPRDPKSGPGNEVDELYWSVEVSCERDDVRILRQIWVDAHTGEVEGDDDKLVHLTYIVTHPTLRGMYSQSLPLTMAKLDPRTKEAERSSILADPCYGTGVVIQDHLCGTWQQVGLVTTLVADGVGNYVADAGGTSKTRGKPFRFTTAEPFGDATLGSSNAKTVASDAFFHMGVVFNYVHNNFNGFQGLDGSNAPQVHAMVKTNITNSSIWDQRTLGILVGSPSAQYFDMASLDVIAHELGHAFNQFGPNLRHAQKGQFVESGKIAEATADMLAMLVSNEDWGDPVPFWIGEQTIRANYNGSTFTNAGLAFRYMDDPERHPGDVACYYPDIARLENHRGAGPANHMFYLLTYGGVSQCNGQVVQGVGAAAAAKIYWMGFRRLSSNATYASLRSAFVGAAMQLHPGPNPIVLTTAAAFDAVNVP